MFQLTENYYVRKVLFKVYKKSLRAKFMDILYQLQIIFPAHSLIFFKLKHKLNCRYHQFLICNHTETEATYDQCSSTVPVRNYMFKVKTETLEQDAEHIQS